MRTLTATQTAVFDAATRGVFPSVYVRVEIDQTGSGGWVDMSDLNGWDYIDSFSYSENRNTDVSTISVGLKPFIADEPSTSISPNATSSIPNTGGVLLQGDRKVRVYTATVPMGTPKPDDASSYWINQFEGRLTKPTVNATAISVVGRDQGGELQDTWIETVNPYGSTGSGTAVQTVMQSILTDWARTTTTLYSENGTSGTPFAGGDAPGWNIFLYNQQRMPILQALKVMADQIGYSLRYRYHEGSGIDDFVLVLEEPDRAVTTSQWTIPKEAIASISVINDETRIRNVVLVTYNDRAKGGAITTYTATDPTSTTTYGRRPIIIGVGAASQIDSSAEAQTMAEAILDDLKDRAEVISVRIPYAYHLQLNDYVTLEADGKILDADKDASIVSIRHTVGRDGAWTDLRLSGKPTNGEDRHAGKAQPDTTGKLSTNNLSASFVRGVDGVLAKNGDFSDWGNG